MSKPIEIDMTNQGLRAPPASQDRAGAPSGSSPVPGLEQSRSSTGAALLALAERCEEADGPSRSRDRAIALATGWKLLVVQKDEWFLPPNGGTPTSHPHYTASIDTALTLVPDDHDWLVRDDDGGAFANVSRHDATNITEFHHPDFMPSEEELDRQGFAQGHHYARAATPALALAAAALKARAHD